jgi:plastocyanin
MRASVPAAVVVSLAVLVGACGGGGSSGSDDGTAQPTPLSTAADATVRLVTDSRTIGAFEPKSISVRVGGVVEFPNESNAAHDVAFSAKTVKDSKPYGPGKNFKATFPVAGTYAYKCTLHPGMKGDITVA